MKKYLSLFLVSLVLQGCVTLGTEQPANALNDSKVVVRGIETAASDYKSGPTTLVVLFPGGSGQLGLAEQSTKVTSYLTDNFLVRSRHLFLTPSTVVLTMDCVTNAVNCPSDYRKSIARAMDTRLLIGNMKTKYPGIKNVWLVGTSRGVIDAAAVALHSPDLVDGVIYTSGVLWEMTSYIDLKQIKAKQVIVHHVDDACALSNIKNAEEISQDFGVGLVKVKFGQGKGIACGAISPHGFFNQEPLVTKAINEIISSGEITIRELP